MTYRDDNEIMKTLISVIEEYDGFVMGIGSKNDFYSFNTKGVKKPLEIPTTEVKKIIAKKMTVLNDFLFLSRNVVKTDKNNLDFQQFYL